MLGRANSSWHENKPTAAVAEPVSDAGGTFVLTYLQMARNVLQRQIGKEVRGGCASCSRTEIHFGPWRK